MNDLLIQQDNLQKEGEEVLQATQLREYFGKLGSVFIGGSFISGLMTWRDLDIIVTLDTLPSLEQISQMTEDMLKIQGIYGVSIIDNLIIKNSHHPEGIYFGLKYLTADQEKWKIDLWFVTSELTSNEKDLAWLKEKVTPATRLMILTIKNAIHDNANYKKTIFSIDIYKAVLDEGVKNLEEFKEYLASLGRIL